MTEGGSGARRHAPRGRARAAVACVCLFATCSLALWLPSRRHAGGAPAHGGEALAAYRATGQLDHPAVQAALARARGRPGHRERATGSLLDGAWEHMLREQDKGCTGVAQDTLDALGAARGDDAHEEHGGGLGGALARHHARRQGKCPPCPECPEQAQQQQAACPPQRERECPPQAECPVCTGAEVRASLAVPREGPQAQVGGGAAVARLQPGVCTSGATREHLAPRLGETEAAQARWLAGLWPAVDAMYARATPHAPGGADPRDPPCLQRYEIFEPTASCGPHGEGLRRVGGDGDGGKLVCGMESYDVPGCVVYSLGSNNNFAFEEGVAAATRHCAIEIFDCTIDEAHIPAAIAGRAHFHPWCLGPRNEVVKGREFKTLSAISRELGHADTEAGVAVLKVDIEGAEFSVLWEVLTAQAAPGETAVLPSQILLELHWNLMDAATGAYSHHSGGRRRSTGELAMLAMAMHQRGYRLVSREDNELSGHWGAFGAKPEYGRHNERGCGDGSEVTFVRVLCDDVPALPPPLKATTGHFSRTLSSVSSEATTTTKKAASKSSKGATNLLGAIRSDGGGGAAQSSDLQPFVGETVRLLPPREGSPRHAVTASARSLKAQLRADVSTTPACPALLGMATTGAVVAQGKPPEQMPAGTEAAYTLGGRVQLAFEGMLGVYYRDDTEGGSETHTKESRTWGKKEIARMEKEFQEGGCSSAYLGQGRLLCDALRAYNLKGKRVAVLGSQTPWVEAAVLGAGAASVLTVEYQAITCEDHRIEVTTPSAVAEALLGDGARQLVDAAVSFSSLEHDGLGRYGDPVSPFSDVEAAARAACLVKPGGLMFLSVPTGRDIVAWNIHRVYGPVRLPLLVAAWHLVDVVGDFNFTNDEINFNHPVLVLERPIDNEAMQWSGNMQAWWDTRAGAKTYAFAVAALVAFVAFAVRAMRVSRRNASIKRALSRQM